MYMTKNYSQACDKCLKDINYDIPYIPYFCFKKEKTICLKCWKQLATEEDIKYTIMRVEKFIKINEKLYPEKVEEIKYRLEQFKKL